MWSDHRTKGSPSSFVGAVFGCEPQLRLDQRGCPSRLCPRIEPSNHRVKGRCEGDEAEGQEETPLFVDITTRLDHPRFWPSHEVSRRAHKKIIRVRPHFAGRATIHSPKTEHHEGGESRVIPLFPELRTLLEDELELTGDGPHVLPSRIRSHANPGTMLRKIIKRTGLKVWPKL